MMATTDELVALLLEARDGRVLTRAELTRAAQAIATGTDTSPALDPACAGCGKPITRRPGPGRPRIWCSEPCRDRHRR